ncbi:hypothetical protein CapIbe_011277 [Capra ibex]
MRARRLQVTAAEQLPVGKRGEERGRQPQPEPHSAACEFNQGGICQVNKVEEGATELKLQDGETEVLNLY